MNQGAALVFSFHTFIKDYIMSTLMDCHKQWAVRPAEERFTSLHSMLATLETQRAISRARTVSSRSLRAVPVEGTNANDWGLVIEGPAGGQLALTNWAFNQAATLAARLPVILRACRRRWLRTVLIGACRSTVTSKTSRF
jgi:hypothetical protein